MGGLVIAAALSHDAGGTWWGELAGVDADADDLSVITLAPWLGLSLRPADPRAACQPAWAPNNKKLRRCNCLQP